MDTAGEGREENAVAIKRAIPAHKSCNLIFDLAALPLLAVVSLAIGASVNVLRPELLPWQYQSREQALSKTVTRLQDTLETPPDANDFAEPTHEIRLEDFQPFVTGHRGLVIDARPAGFYRDAHVPGALSLPRDTFEADYPRLRNQLEAYKDKPIAVYCSGADCPDSELVAEALTKLGYRKLVIYTSGWEEWSQTGLPQESVVVPP